MKTDNQLVAEFLGLELCDCGKGNLHYKTGPMNWQVADIGQLKYDSSWDALIPACKKWDDLPLSEFSETDKLEYGKLCDDLDHFVSCYEIIPAYNQLVKNIKWYNEWKTQSSKTLST